MLLLALLAAAAAGPNDGKVVATDDWQTLSIVAVGRDAPSGPIFLKVQAIADLDGDGRADDAVVRVTCADGSMREAAYTILGPRDAGSGIPTGKRQHAPVTFVKEWGAASPQLMAVKPTYDVKKVEGTGARMTTDGGGWTALSLSNADGLCPAAEAAAATIVKSKSNITNN